MLTVALWRQAQASICAGAFNETNHNIAVLSHSCNPCPQASLILPYRELYLCLCSRRSQIHYKPFCAVAAADEIVATWLGDAKARARQRL